MAGGAILAGARRKWESLASPYPGVWDGVGVSIHWEFSPGSSERLHATRRILLLDSR